MSLQNNDGVEQRDWMGSLLPTLLTVWVAVAAILAQADWEAVVAMSLLGVGVVGLQSAPALPWPRLGSTRRALASRFGLLAWSSLLLATFLWDPSLGGVAAVVSAAAAAVHCRTAPASSKNFLKMLAFVCVGGPSLICLWAGYTQNVPGAFYSGFLSILALLVFCRLWLGMTSIGVQVVNTLFFLLAGLPMADRIYQMHHEPEIRPETFRDYYSYEKAKGDPKAFIRAQNYIGRWCVLMKVKIFASTGQASPPFSLRPNSRFTLVQCPISINSREFRGREIALEKGDAYRIVALGESTTFGMTYGPDDKPWPELLEQMIRERLKTRRPVEVINAGVPAYSLYDNLSRLQAQILPLKPDMIISYHGANGFYSLDSTLLHPLGADPPPYGERPLKLAADFEHKIRLLLFRNRELKKMPADSVALANPMQTEYAGAYRQLIRIAATNHIRLMLANYSTAVSRKSDPSVINFYQGAYGASIPGFIKANQVHSLIVQNLAAQHPEVRLIDTHPHLDGEHEKFTDTMHFTQEGRQQLAENIFAGIRKTLEDDIGR